MKRFSPFVVVSLFALLLTVSCKKNPVTPKEEGPSEPPASAALKGPVTLYLTDYYPDRFTTGMHRLLLQAIPITFICI